MAAIVTTAPSGSPAEADDLARRFGLEAWPRDARPLHEILVSAAAGAIGAIVSVLQRMASEKSKFAVHYDLGKRTLYMLGSNRPVLGVVFGVFTYFVLASGILGTSPPPNTNPLYYYGSLAFVAGFSERFTRVLAKSVEGLVPAQGATDEQGSEEQSLGTSAAR